MQCVVDHLDELLQGLDSKPSRNAKLSASAIRQTLSNLALSHRDWTYMSQRALFRRVPLDKSLLDSFLPMMVVRGNWVQRIIFQYDVRPDSLPWETHLSRLEDIVRSATELKQFDLLVVHYGHGVPPSPPMQLRTLLTKMSTWSSLTKLSLSTQHETSMIPGLLWICQVVPHLQKLESLAVKNFSSDVNDARDLPLPSDSPPSTLKTIELEACSNLPGYRYDAQALNWLLMQRGDYALSSLSIKLVDYQDQEAPIDEYSSRHLTEKLYEIFRNTPPDIVNLEFLIIDEWSVSGSFFSRLLPLFHKLKYLHLDNMSIGFIDLDSDLVHVPGTPIHAPERVDHRESALRQLEIDEIVDSFDGPRPYGALPVFDAWCELSFSTFRFLERLIVHNTDPVLLSSFEQSCEAYGFDLSTLR